MPKTAYIAIRESKIFMLWDGEYILRRHLFVDGLNKQRRIIRTH